MAHYDGSLRDITEAEALALSREEYQMISQYGQHHVLSRGSDGGMHIRDTFTHSQAAIVWMNTRRKDLRERLLAGKCQHTCFYDRSRDRFWIG